MLTITIQPFNLETLLLASGFQTSVIALATLSESLRTQGKVLRIGEEGEKKVAVEMKI